MMDKWNNQKVLILGAARQGLALARYLANNGAMVTVNDSRPESIMNKTIAAHKNLNINWVFGAHPLSLLDNTDLLCISGGVPLDIPIVKEALARDIPLSNDSQIFMEQVKCPVIGITGSAGKTTTTALLGNIAKTHYQNKRKVWVGGNIGLPLIDQVEQISKDDLVILELSSFQLELMTISPQISAVLNITPNHLDRHKTIEAYTDAKSHILTYQSKNDTAVLGFDDPVARSLENIVNGDLVTFNFDPTIGNNPCCYKTKDKLYLFDGNKHHLIMDINNIKLRGDHNIKNVLAACACAFAEGITIESMTEGTRTFNGISHRMELIKTINGVDWYNDSIATAPERTIAAIRSFNEPIILLLGGRDKNLPWNDLADLIQQRIDHVVVFGESSKKIINAIKDAEISNTDKPSVDCFIDLEDAVKKAHQLSEPGDIVLLSPGGTSYDAFKDFEERGEKFKTWVNQLI